MIQEILEKKQTIFLLMIPLHLIMIMIIITNDMDIEIVKIHIRLMLQINISIVVMYDIPLIMTENMIENINMADKINILKIEDINIIDNILMINNINTIGNIHMIKGILIMISDIQTQNPIHLKMLIIKKVFRMQPTEKKKNPTKKKMKSNKYLNFIFIMISIIIGKKENYLIKDQEIKKQKIKEQI